MHRFCLLRPKNRHPCFQVMSHLWQPKQFSQRLPEAWVCFIWQRFLKVAIRECFLKMSRNVRHILRPTGNTIIQKRRVKIMWINTQSDLRGISFSLDDTTNEGQGSSLFSDLSSCLHRHYRLTKLQPHVLRLPSWSTTTRWSSHTLHTSKIQFHDHLLQSVHHTHTVPTNPTKGLHVQP